MTTVLVRAASVQRQVHGVGEASSRSPGLQGLGVALMLAFVLSGCDQSGSSVPPSQPSRQTNDFVQVSAEQMHQVDVVAVRAVPFPIKKSAIGQIAFNEDAST